MRSPTWWRSWRWPGRWCWGWMTCSGPIRPACSRWACWPAVSPACRWVSSGACGPPRRWLSWTGWPALEAVGARHLILRPLTGEAVTGLVAQAVAAEPGPRLLAEVAGAAGNPLFVTELLGALAQEEAITTAGGRAEVTQTVLPPTLRLTILRRVSFLPEPTLQALRSASILGSGFSLTDLATITGRLAVDLS